MDANTQYALAYALTTTAGLRGFLTLLAASVATHVGWLHPSPSFRWLESDGATIALAVGAAAELLADKVPLVDHALHVVSFAVRPLAAAILVGATIHTSSTGGLYAMMAIGALNALLVHGSMATARAGTSLATLGFGNIVLSAAEDVIAAAGIAVSFWKPLIAAAIALLFVIAVVSLTRVITARVRTLAPRHDR